ncbi:hypothetical protein [Marinobacter shengliensis]|uniref:hypothetical protein n=1 Tax=Marinobacter shengliensis TaxID=1389223 RepID=UPI001109B280|nr:hypothetical protein [Marinobacter shengliensis]
MALNDSALIRKKTTLATLGATLGVALLASGWFIYDRDRPYTGLAALVYSEATLKERKAADQEVNEITRATANIAIAFCGDVGEAFAAGKLSEAEFLNKCSKIKE